MLLKAKLCVWVHLFVLSQEKVLSRLLAISLGFFYRFRTKKTFSTCLQLVTLMLAYFTQNNVIVCLQLNWVTLRFISRNATFLLFCSSALSFREQRCFGHELRFLDLCITSNSICLFPVRKLEWSNKSISCSSTVSANLTILSTLNQFSYPCAFRPDKPFIQV